MYDSGELEILNPEECRELLRETKMARFVFWDRIHYAVHPIKYICDKGTRLLFRTDSGSKFMVASRRQDVTVEIDHLDPIRGDGWSVIASGQASRITDPFEVENVLKKLPYPWAANGGAEVICVSIDFLEGRRLRLASNGSTSVSATIFSSPWTEVPASVPDGWACNLRATSSETGHLDDLGPSARVREILAA